MKSPNNYNIIEYIRACQSSSGLFNKGRMKLLNERKLKLLSPGFKWCTVGNWTGCSFCLLKQMVLQNLIPTTFKNIQE